MWIAETIASAFADSGAHVQDMVEDATHDLGFPLHGLSEIARRIIEQWQRGLPRDAESIRRAILIDDKFQELFETEGQDVPLPGILFESAQSKQDKVRTRWKQLPQLNSVADLASLLEVEVDFLHWLIRNPSNYRRSWIRKRSSGLRLVEAPRPLLKSVQRKILDRILYQVPTHDSAYGFIRKRGVVDFASQHVGQNTLIKLDLKDFFPTLRFARVLGWFRCVGFGKEVAEVLTRLCTTRCPEKQMDRSHCDVANQQLQELKRLYSPFHLPQGAPTSPMLANLCAYRLDARLTGFSNSQSLQYSRYADDLLFSGDRQLSRQFDWFTAVVGGIVLEEGFQLNYRKTRLMKSSVRQSAAGIVLNQHTNISRKDYDRLKAILNNCLVHGVVGQNRDNHPDFRAQLAGKIAWVSQLNPHRGSKLRKLFTQIRW